MIKAIDANMYLYLFVENIAPIQEIDTANCIYCFNHYRNIFFTLNVHNNNNDLIVTNAFIIAPIKYIYFSKRPLQMQFLFTIKSLPNYHPNNPADWGFWFFKLGYPQT